MLVLTYKRWIMCCLFCPWTNRTHVIADHFMRLYFVSLYQFSCRKLSGQCFLFTVESVSVFPPALHIYLLLCKCVILKGSSSSVVKYLVSHCTQISVCTEVHRVLFLSCLSQIPVACKSCPCGYVFISRKLLNAKLNERSPVMGKLCIFYVLCIWNPYIYLSFLYYVMLNYVLLKYLSSGL